MDLPEEEGLGVPYLFFAFLAKIAPCLMVSAASSEAAVQVIVRPCRLVIVPEEVCIPGLIVATELDRLEMESQPSIGVSARSHYPVSVSEGVYIHFFESFPSSISSVCVDAFTITFPLSISSISSSIVALDAVDIYKNFSSVHTYNN